MNKDMIHMPTHYMSNGEETIVKIVRELGIVEAIAFCKGNVIKYADRADHKGQKESDLAKIEEYTQMANDLKRIQYHVYMIQYHNKFMCVRDEITELVKKWSENGHSLEGIL